MQYIYSKLSFMLNEYVYDLYLTRECFSDDKKIIILAAKMIDNMLSEHLDAKESLEFTQEAPQEFISFLERKYQVSIAAMLCLDFETTVDLSIQKYIPLAKENTCNTEVSILE